MRLMSQMGLSPALIIKGLEGKTVTTIDANGSLGQWPDNCRFITIDANATISGSPYFPYFPLASPDPYLRKINRRRNRILDHQ